MPRPRLCVLFPSYDNGGIERMLVNTANGLSRREVHVDFLTATGEGPYLQDLGDAVNRIALGASRGGALYHAFVRYLRASQPHIVLPAKDDAMAIAVRAKRYSGVPFKLLFRPGTTVSRQLEFRNVIKRWKVVYRMRRDYRYADAVVANSHGLAQDTIQLTGVDARTVTVIRNPVITPHVYARAREAPAHPWLQHKDRPVVMGIGGMRRQKDFQTLIAAFARAHRARSELRLIILGQGRRLRRLQQLAHKLCIADAVAFPGFVENPYAWLSRADLFVLSSLWEGSPNVLTEALALGIPAVATDCPSGPRETLQDGAFGPLVPMQDADAMATAMLQTLDAPLPADTLRKAVTDYTVEESAKRYREVIDQLLGIGR